MKREPAYASEADLCAEFIAAVRRDNKWEAYPESGGFDILLDDFRLFLAKTLLQSLLQTLQRKIGHKHKGAGRNGVLHDRKFGEF